MLTDNRDWLDGFAASGSEHANCVRFVFEVTDKTFEGQVGFAVFLVALGGDLNSFWKFNEFW